MAVFPYMPQCDIAKNIANFQHTILIATSLWYCLCCCLLQPLLGKGERSLTLPISKQEVNAPMQAPHRRKNEGGTKSSPLLDFYGIVWLLLQIK